MRKGLVFYFLLLFVGALVRFVPSVSAQVAPPPNFKVAFIGDSGDGSGQRSVLDLIKREGAQLVVHQGDFSYSPGPTTSWINNINAALGVNFPYLASDGNHDTWSQYIPFFQSRLTTMGFNGTSVLPSSNTGSYSVNYQGIKFVFSKENGDPTFIDQQLASSNNIWKICSWHTNMATMQLGSKTDEQGWGDYDNCKKSGALIITAHEHSYERTKTLTNFQTLTVDTAQHPRDAAGVPQNPNSLLVAPGKTAVFVSGSGGVGLRNQDRCLPTTYPYGGGAGCNYIWANAYTLDQGAVYGALFIAFNVDGNPNKARGYFKSINGQIIDQFDITASTTQVTPTPTRVVTVTPTPTRVVTITPSTTVVQKAGDANGDGKVDGVDFTIWLTNYSTTTTNGPRNGDFNGDGKVDGVDFTIWLTNYGK